MTISPMFTGLLIPFLAAMFLAINMGGSGTAPAFSAAYGARIIRKDLVPGLFGLFVFLGAILAGKKVALTMSGGVLPASSMSIELTTIILLSVGLALLIANLLGVPQSTTQAATLALIGPALYLGNLQTEALFTRIIPIWFILPLISFVIALVVGRYIYKPIARSEKLPLEKISASKSWKVIVIVTSCYVAFSIGSNNVANAAGPILSMTANELQISSGDSGYLLIMILSTLLIAPNFAIGSSLFGPKLINTTGKDIITIGPLGATFVSLLTSTLLLLASSVYGIPTSLVQMNVMAIIGLGISKVGWKTLRQQTPVLKIVVVWFITPLIALLIALALTFLAGKIGIL